MFLLAICKHEKLKENENVLSEDLRLWFNAFMMEAIII